MSVACSQQSGGWLTSIYGNLEANPAVRRMCGYTRQSVRFTAGSDGMGLSDDRGAPLPDHNGSPIQQLVASPARRLMGSSQMRTQGGAEPRPGSLIRGHHRPPEVVTLTVIAVGTDIAASPPHRSQRALLTHWAPASGSGVEPSVREGVQ